MIEADKNVPFRFVKFRSVVGRTMSRLTLMRELTDLGPQIGCAIAAQRFGELIGTLLAYCLVRQTNLLSF